MMRERGVTLIELILTIVILSVAVGGILIAFTTAVRHSADPFIQHQAVAIAEAYVEEIALRPFADPDGISGELSRASFDDLFDYHGLAGAPADQFGTPLGLPDYSVAVSVTAAPPEGFGGLPGAEVARIDVTVTHTSGMTVALSTYRANH